VLTYRDAPPLPAAISDPTGRPLMTHDDIVAGKGGFQKADLMDYGSIYGMGSYFGEDYTASTLNKLGLDTREAFAQATYGKPFAALAVEQKYVATETMRRQLQQVDLTRNQVVLPDALAKAVQSGQVRIATALRTLNLPAGWTPAKSLSPELAQQTADFILYSALTTVARRPGTTGSWTENWPFEPLVGNAPTTNTFHWTWISFCFTFFAFGAVLFLYRTWLDHPDDAPMERSLIHFGPLTDSQRRVGKYFLVVALVFLASQGAGAVMAHSYYDRETFYGIQLNYLLPFNFLRSFHTQAPIIWIGLGWIGSGLFLAPAIAGGREARGQGILVELLFWVSLPAFAAAGLFLSYETTAFNLGHFLLFYAAGAAFSGALMALPTRVPLVAALAIFVVVAVASNALGMDYHSMGALPLAIAGILLTCVAGVALAHSRAASAMTALGQYSMSIYVMHILVASGARIALHKAHVPVNGEGMLLIGTVLGIAVPVAVHVALMRLDLLWIFGLGKKRAAPAAIVRETELA